jgi:hypothetical protein
MSIQASKLRQALNTLVISSEARQQLQDAVASGESFIILPAGELASKWDSKNLKSIILSKNDFDVLVPPKVASASVGKLISDAFEAVLIVHPDEPDPAFVESLHAASFEGGARGLSRKREPKPVTVSKEAADLVDRATRK